MANNAKKECKRLITGKILLNSIISGANNIKNNKELVDSLNIFPVPDGDTGTNMSMTIGAGAKELFKLPENVSVSEVAKISASSLLRGARGNSGVILSLLFKGFAKGLNGLESATGKNLVNALSLGVEFAYKAVMNPMEGTILTVARIAYEKGNDASFFNDDPIFIWEEICKGAHEALENTPELLPVLKKAGVVDAGGKGLTLIFDGMLETFKEGTIISEEKNSSKTESKPQSIFEQTIAKFDDDIRFTYCTEFIVGRNKEVQIEPCELKAYLETIGDCVVVVDDEEIIKVHVHTENPGLALQEGLNHGQLLTVKVENMKEQNRLAKENYKSEKNKLEPVEPTEDVGFVSVAAGDGLVELFKELGCMHVVCGGQTMNPSTEDILEAVLATPCKTVFVLPNNKNIILAAEQAVKLCKDRELKVVPSKTIPQGISAMLAFDPDLDLNGNFSNMLDSLKNVKTGQITFASRDAEFGGFKIKEGEILALSDGKLSFKSKDPVKACVKLISSLVKKDSSFITIIYGEDISDEEANAVYEQIEAKYGRKMDITLINGQQSIYHFIISIE